VGGLTLQGVELGEGYVGVGEAAFAGVALVGGGEGAEGGGRGAARDGGGGGGGTDGRG
jgi:hypothetical protein